MALRGFVFVGPSGAARGQAMSGVEGSKVSMQFFGAPAPAPPPPPAPVDFEPDNYIISMCILMAASVLANSNGFFGPW